MEKSCPSTAAAPDSTTTSSINRQSTDHFLKQLNKSSHKISKHPHQSHPHHHLSHPKQPSHASQPSHHNNNPQQHQQQNQQQQQQQPPVYNINKNDFRDVVQKLTGSPAHDRFSTPPPIHPPKPPSSRLQRIRPPPLAQISTRPPPCVPPTLFTDNNLNSNSSSNNYNYNNYNNTNNNNSGIFIGRPRSPFSPLPPFPTVSATAESPISAYMKYLQGSMSYVDPGRAPGFSPRWNPNVTSSFQQALFPSPTANPPPSQLLPPQFLLPTSPMAFGHIPLSPRSPYPLLSPSLLFSPSAQLGFPPVSPRLPVPSPRWRDL